MQGGQELMQGMISFNSRHRASQMMLAALLLLISATPLAHRSSENARLLVAGPAPEFSLLDQNGAPFTLTGLRGKVVVVTFISPQR